MCVYASSFATAIVLLSKISGREGHLNVYLTWLGLIPNWAYSTLLPSLCLCLYSPCFIFYILCSKMTGRTIYHFLVEGESHHLPPTAGSLEKTNLFLFFMHIMWNYLYNVVPGYMQKKLASISGLLPASPHQNFTYMTFEPCAELRREKAWKIFIT